MIDIEELDDKFGIEGEVGFTNWKKIWFLLWFRINMPMPKFACMVRM